MNDALPSPESYPCRECQAGKVWLNYITYFTWLGDELITVPNFPAWICDVCGKREYDERAIHWLYVYAGSATSGGEGAALSRERDIRLRQLGRLPG